MLCGTPALVWTVLANLQRDMEAQLDLFLQTIKTEVYSQNEVYGNMPKSSQVNTLPIAKSQTRSKQNKGMHKCNDV
jgi:hypothetical protein